jgi:hypothetical protein
MAAIELSADGTQVLFNIGQRRFTCGVQGEACSSAERPAARPEVLSPDGKRAAFIRDWNLWVRDVATGQEAALTTDGVKDYGYATDNAGWRFSDRPVVKWSPDSRRIATFQQDQRGVGEMYLVDTRVGHPKLDAWKYPLPGDRVVTMIERVVIDVERKRVVRLKVPPDQHRSTLCDDVICGSDWVDVQWAPDSRSLAFVSSSRDHKLAELKVADAQTGTVRDVIRSGATGDTCISTTWRPASRSARSPSDRGTSRSFCTWTSRPARCISARWAAKAIAIRTSATSTACRWTASAWSCCRRRTATTISG